MVEPHLRTLWQHPCGEYKNKCVESGSTILQYQANKDILFPSLFVDTFVTYTDSHIQMCIWAQQHGRRLNKFKAGHEICTIMPWDVAMNCGCRMYPRWVVKLSWTETRSQNRDRLPASVTSSRHSDITRSPTAELSAVDGDVSYLISRLFLP